MYFSAEQLVKLRYSKSGGDKPPQLDTRTDCIHLTMLFSRHSDARNVFPNGKVA